MFYRREHPTIDECNLQALDGFLFVVNNDLRLEYVTDNIVQYTNHPKDEVIGKDIFNFLHHGDLVAFRNRVKTKEDSTSFGSLFLHSRNTYSIEREISELIRFFNRGWY